jgi:hypothetical protein
VGRERYDADERGRRSFARRSWERHPVLIGVFAACGVGIGVVGLLTALRYDGDRPDWLTWLYLALLAISFAVVVLLVRRDEDPPA